MFPSRPSELPWSKNPLIYYCLKSQQCTMLICYYATQAMQRKLRKRSLGNHLERISFMVIFLAFGYILRANLNSFSSCMNFDSKNF